MTGIAVYKSIGLKGGEFVPNVELPSYIRNNERAIVSLATLYDRMQSRQCNPERMNAFMRALLDKNGGPTYEEYFQEIEHANNHWKNTRQRRN